MGIKKCTFIDWIKYLAINLINNLTMFQSFSRLSQSEEEKSDYINLVTKI